jgi:hypothetical protein
LTVLQKVDQLQYIQDGSERTKAVPTQSLNIMRSAVEDPVAFIFSSPFEVMTDEACQKIFAGNPALVETMKKALEMPIEPPSIKYARNMTEAQQEAFKPFAEAFKHAYQKRHGEESIEANRFKNRLREAKVDFLRPREFTEWLNQPEQHVSFKEYVMGTAQKGNPFFDALGAPKYQQEVTAQKTPENIVQEGELGQKVTTPLPKVKNDGRGDRL